MALLCPLSSIRGSAMILATLHTKSPLRRKAATPYGVLFGDEVMAFMISMSTTCSKCRSKFLQFIVKGKGNFNALQQFQYPRIINTTTFASVPHSEVKSEPEKNESSADGKILNTEKP
jgi:hypothetical protein